jgi:5'-3' exonuclease
MDLVNSKGVVVGGVHGFLKSLSTIVCKRLRTEGVIVAWDLGVPLHRRELHANYKPHKTPISVNDPKLLSEMNKQGYKEEDDPDRGEFRKVYAQSARILHELLPLTGTLSVRLPDVEADDIISVWSYYVKGAKSVIYTSDVDLVQLVSDNVDFFDVRHDKYITKDDIIKEGGYNPLTWRRDWLLAKAIFGDKSDSIDGVEQVGKKAAPEYAKQIGAYIDQGCTIEQACEKDLERPYRGKKEGLENMHKSGTLIKRNFELMDLFLPINRNLPIVREIKSGICANAIMQVDRSKAVSKLDELELYKAQDFCVDLIESNRADNLKEYIKFFL